MNENHIEVFFYGLFMDSSLLKAKGIAPSYTTIGHVDGFRLRIGKRATLVPERAGRAYGVLMTIDRHEAAALYADASVADYVPEPVSVTLRSGVARPAVCYNLPPGKLEGANPAYARSLLQLATKLEFPADYLDAIRREGEPDPRSGRASDSCPDRPG